ncbi:uncharacterized protein LOC123648145 [Lemur catta]|uniref:uncharacterized protein LOC123648145 n=1 Tax=Lemur catta TaxID=9447 RepID=UPI001E267D4F|nr:uncharacterized protein LOC123648145 [Lemur catta]
MPSPPPGIPPRGGPSPRRLFPAYPAGACPPGWGRGSGERGWGWATHAAAAVGGEGPACRPLSRGWGGRAGPVGAAVRPPRTSPQPQGWRGSFGPGSACLHCPPAFPRVEVDQKVGCRRGARRRVPVPVPVPVGVERKGLTVSGSRFRPSRGPRGRPDVLVTGHSLCWRLESAHAASSTLGVSGKTALFLPGRELCSCSFLTPSEFLTTCPKMGDVWTKRSVREKTRLTRGREDPIITLLSYKWICAFWSDADPFDSQIQIHHSTTECMVLLIILDTVNRKHFSG